MRMLKVAAFSVALGIGGLASAATAATVVNGSFEKLPAGGLPNPCGVGCFYSQGPVPDWTIYGPGGQFQPGPSSGNYTYFNSVPNGVTVAWLEGTPTGDPHDLGGYLYEDLGPVVAGVTYTLNADIGFRKDIPDNGLIALQVGETTDDFYGTGTPSQLSGNWVDYTAKYTGTAADAGQQLYVVLFSGNSGQADFDDVSVSVPEPATWAMMLLGVGMIGAGLRMARRKNGMALTAA